MTSPHESTGELRLSPWAVFDPRDEFCAFMGHEWVPAGGGLLICAECEAEKWSSQDREKEE